MTDIFFHSDMPSAMNNKAPNVPVRTSSSAWPTQGGLQSITNTNTVRATGQPYIEVPEKAAATVAVVPDNGDSVKNTKTPSPKKITIKVEPASGKENYTTATAQSNK